MAFIVLFAIALLGWLAGKFQRWSDEYTGVVGVAAILGILAITTGKYWTVFAKADPYSDADNLILGLTPNQLLAFGIFAAVFFCAASIRRKKVGGSDDWRPKRKVAARCDLFRGSRFLTFEIKNYGDDSIFVSSVSFVPSPGKQLLALTSSSVGEASLNYVKLNSFIGPERQLAIELEAASFAHVSGALVHGFDPETNLPWKVKAVVIDKKP
jgi:hypothetical protein